ncbi:hypothetical protein G6F35_016914 [Rhizopus arrhizus]|nr:hypothetical protein G6F35_016914 [Rhizopus arrhizus]
MLRWAPPSTRCWCWTWACRSWTAAMCCSACASAPFALDEFEARVRAQLRRVTSNGNPDLRIGRLRLDLAGHRVWIDDQSLELTAREFGLLSALAVRAERIVSRAQLVEALCDWGQDLTDNGLDIALHRLRRKLQPGGMGIRTVRGLGYMLEDGQDDSAP